MVVAAEQNQDLSPEEDLKAKRKKAAKPMLWIGMASMAMAFAGLTSGYVVSRSALLDKERWMVFELPTYFYISTALIFASSVLMFFAVKAIKKNNQGATMQYLWMAFILGIGFAIFQILGWKELHDGGIFFTGEGSNPAGSWVYAISFFHLLHMAAGLITLLVTAIKSSKGLYSSTNSLGVELCASFWHFLDIVWIYLFLFLLFIR